MTVRLDYNGTMLAQTLTLDAAKGPAPWDGAFVSQVGYSGLYSTTR